VNEMAIIHPQGEKQSKIHTTRRETEWILEIPLRTELKQKPIKFTPAMASAKKSHSPIWLLSKEPT